MHVDINVKYNAGAYVTNTVRGVRASSTSSAQRAAEVFGEKYFGPSFVEVAPQSTDFLAHGVKTTPLSTAFRVHGDDRAFAWCWQSGLIDIGEAAPEGALLFAAGPRRALEEQITAAARHGTGKSKGLLLVPGVPEARNPDAAVEALISFVEWRAERNGVHQVVFSRDARELTR